MPPSRSPRVAVLPDRAPDWLREAVRSGGGTVVAATEAEALVWASPRRPDELRDVLIANPGLSWVQLPWAGVEPYLAVMDATRTWTSGKGVYAEPVAEHALMLLLAGLRGGVRYARTDHWSEQVGTSLVGGRVTIVGGGGIAEALVRLLEPFDAAVTVVRRRPRPMPGVARVLEPRALHESFAGADGVVLALPVLPDTVGLVDAAALEAMEGHAWLVNVARGVHVVTDDLVAALTAGAIGGAGLDVTDPEPLPDDHPLWRLPNCVITPHTGNTAEMAVPLLSARVRENVRRFGAGQPLVGVVDPGLGY